MNAFRTLDDAALQSRAARLKIEEQDLASRVDKQKAALEAAGRWYKSDPLYQRLSSVLSGIRASLRHAEGQ